MKVPLPVLPGKGKKRERSVDESPLGDEPQAKKVSSFEDGVLK